VKNSVLPRKTRPASYSDKPTLPNDKEAFEDQIPQDTNQTKEPTPLQRRWQTIRPLADGTHDASVTLLWEPLLIIKE
jgi:hypothetical protein